jgi:hypothetical protein
MRSHRFIAVAAALACLGPASVRAFEWELDFATAQKRAKAQNRPLLLSFSGLDWDGWSMTLKQEVFDTRTFASYADQNLICMLVDFPQGYALPRGEIEQNKRLMSTYKVDGLPTVVILSPDGVELGRTGYRDGGANEYVNHLRRLIAAGMAATTNTSATTAADRSGLRTWTDTRGVTVEAGMVTATTEKVTLRTAEGQEQDILRSKLSQFDNNYIDTQMQTAE